jgi:CRP/FNR family transcriptional regulator, nitrogen oxide reductase regulator
VNSVQAARTLRKHSSEACVPGGCLNQPQAEIKSSINLLFANCFESPFFRGLSKCDLESIVAAATQWFFPAGAVVTNQGDPADRLFVVLRGSARYCFYTQEGRKLSLMWLAPGDLFGASALLEVATPYLCGVEVTKGTRVLLWERDIIRNLAARYPKLLENALSVASDYLVWYVATHVALTCHTARKRVAEVLISLARGVGQEVPGGIVLDITNEQLADAASVTLFTASRLTAEWKRTGAIHKTRGKILLRFPERLLAMSAPGGRIG